MRGVLLYTSLVIANTISASLAVLEVMKYLMNFHKYQIMKEHYSLIFLSIKLVELEIRIAVIAIFIIKCIFLYLCILYKLIYLRFYWRYR